jgi:NCS1 family nucleobase:cation symporter-1
VTQYEAFLLLIGSVFVPLFGVLATDYFLVRRSYDRHALFPPGEGGAVSAALNWRGMVAWAVGILVYLGIAGKLEPLGLAGVPAIGASLPSLAAASLSHLAASAGSLRSRGDALR